MHEPIKFVSLENSANNLVKITIGFPSGLRHEFSIDKNDLIVVSEATQEHMYGPHVHESINGDITTRFDADFCVTQTIHSSSYDGCKRQYTYSPRYTLNS